MIDHSKILSYSRADLSRWIRRRFIITFQKIDISQFTAEVLIHNEAIVQLMEDLENLKGRIDDCRSNIFGHLATTGDVETGSTFSPVDRSSEPLDFRCEYSSLSSSSSSKIQCSLDRLRILSPSSNTLTKEVDCHVCSNTKQDTLSHSPECILLLLSYFLRRNLR